jgi:MGT family glycosyltransferase
VTATVAVFCMPQEGHLRRLLPVVRGLHARGLEVHVFTHSRFLRQVSTAGGQLVDLFSAWPLEAADARSQPQSCRFVSYAGHYAAEIVAAVREIGPSLVIYDTFAVIGQLVARELGLPGINVCAGHNLEPAPFLQRLQSDMRIEIAPECLAAVELLRTRHGMADASPFSYMHGLSPSLNIYCEPPEFLAEAERRAFEPLAFYGSLPSIEYIEEVRAGPATPQFRPDSQGQRIYISFGTIVWLYFEREALAAMEALADAIAQQPELDALISFGGAEAADTHASRLERPNVRVAKRVDQWAALREADLFVTHHGLNSTHEAIFHRVPMLSYPFFWDQPALAAKCQAFGIARPLAAQPRGPLTVAGVAQAIQSILLEKTAIAVRLDEARRWELAVMATRDGVIDRLAAIAGTARPA